MKVWRASGNRARRQTNGGAIGMAGRPQAACSVAERGQFLSEAHKPGEGLSDLYSPSTPHLSSRVRSPLISPHSGRGDETHNPNTNSIVWFRMSRSSGV